MRMDKSLKDRSFPIIESYGLTPAQAIKLFLNQIADTKMIPLSFSHHAKSTYNDTTRKSLIEARTEFPDAKRYNSIDEMLQDIQGKQE
jgi:addiction module RelB/DinJ family antitoxin